MHQRHLDAVLVKLPVYWGFVFSDSELRSVPAAGGATTTLAAGANPASFIADDAKSVYWTGGSGPVMKVPVGGGASTTLVVGSMPVGLAVDATSLYWSDLNNGTVMKLTPK